MVGRITIENVPEYAARKSSSVLSRLPSARLTLCAPGFNPDGRSKRTVLLSSIVYPVAATAPICKSTAATVAVLIDASKVTVICVGAVLNCAPLAGTVETT